jgi:hypothetical protein
LKVGKRDYSLVVIPAEMENIDQPTFDLLQEYLENGGKVLSFNPTSLYSTEQNQTKLLNWLQNILKTGFLLKA